MGALGIGTAIGSIVGSAITNKGNKNRQKEAFQQEQTLMDIQQKNQMELNRQGQQLQMETWKNTSYPAQLKMMKEAGINPALMYGQGGAGGATTGSQSGGSAAGGNAPNAIPMQGIGIEGLAEMAQIELAKSQAEKARAEAANLRGEEGTKGAAEIANLLQGIENQKVQKELTKAQTEVQNTTIENLKGQLNKINQETINIGYQNNVDYNTIKTKIEILKQEAIGSALQNALTKHNITKTKEETTAIIEGIKQKYIELKQKDQTIENEGFEKAIKAQYPSLMNVGGHVLNEIIQGVKTLTGTKKKLEPNRK